jgi:hypothetical protein
MNPVIFHAQNEMSGMLLQIKITISCGGGSRSTSFR